MRHNFLKLSSKYQVEDDYVQNTAATAGSIFFTAVDISLLGHNEEGLMIQDHDRNEFMSIMHEMHAEMDAMQMTGMQTTILPA